MDEFNKEDLEFYLPNLFKGLTKKYILDCIFNDSIQKKWYPEEGDIIVGCTGNIFVISGYHKTHKDLGGDKFFFGGGICNRDGGNILNETYSNVLNKDGLEYYYDFSDKNISIKTKSNSDYSKFEDFRFVPYPHEKDRF